MSIHFLVAECEPAHSRDQRRASVGRTAGQTYADLLARLASGCTVDLAAPADAGAPPPDAAALAAYDGICLTGSPLHLYRPTPAARREVAFMQAVFASGIPSFGSCAGLQLAVLAAGGTLRPLRGPREAGFARRIWPTEAGRSHPLLRGRPPAYDAPALHGDEVERLPDGAILLAGNAAAAVQAAEVRHGGGVFWGVQYHPELSIDEIAAAVRRDSDVIVEEGLARDAGEVEAQAAVIEALAREPERLDLHWRLGIDRQVAVDELRHTEVRNFIDHLVRPTRVARGR